MVSIGLVLGGGAALGAYEIGVYQVIEELGLSSSITSIAGSSVGAINGSVLQTHAGFEALSNFWNNVKCSDVSDGALYVACSSQNQEADTNPWENQRGRLGPLEVQNSGILFADQDEYDDYPESYAEALHSPIASSHAFSPNATVENSGSTKEAENWGLLEKEHTYGQQQEHNRSSRSLDATPGPKCTKGLSSHTPLLKSSEQFMEFFENDLNPDAVPVYLSRVRVDTAQLQFVTQVNKSGSPNIETFGDAKGVQDAIMASSSAIPLYECYEVKGIQYRDGGQVAGDNLPYKILEQEENPDVIIVVSVSKKDVMPVGPKYINIKLDDSYSTPQNLITFKSDFAHELIQVGMEDARRILGEAFCSEDSIFD